MRRVALLLVGGLLLGACGSSLSSGQAVTNWAHNSGFRSNLPTLVSDARILKKIVNDPRSSESDLRTFGTVMFEDVSAANASLPTPDTQLTSLLSEAYTNLGSAAQTSYNAAGSARLRAEVMRYLDTGARNLQLATLRLASAEQG